MIQADANVYCQGPLSLPDRSPQTRKGRETSDDNSIAVKFSEKFSKIAI